MIVKYSKSSGEIIKLKQDFFNSNQKHLDRAIEINSKYIRQPFRFMCKNCLAPIGGYDFISFNIAYSVCSQCGHLNGCYEDTGEFINYLYSGDSDYANNYLMDYEQRVANIYLPKIDFLIEVLRARYPFTLTDIGCGAGHLIKACEYRGIEATGYDTNSMLVDLGNTKLINNKVYHCGPDEITDKIRSSETMVISMIGVLEHLQHPHGAIRAFKDSKARYLYIAVPLFSFGTLLEHISPKVYPRHLSGGHTHLYTKESLYCLIKSFNLKILGEWWFGTDMVDLYRTMMVQADSKDLVKKYIGEYVDRLQSVLDKEKACDQVHMVLSK